MASENLRLWEAREAGGRRGARARRLARRHAARVLTTLSLPLSARPLARAHVAAWRRARALVRARVFSRAQTSGGGSETLTRTLGMVLVPERHRAGFEADVPEEEALAWMSLSE